MIPISIVSCIHLMMVLISINCMDIVVFMNQMTIIAFKYPIRNIYPTFFANSLSETTVERTT